MQQLEGKTMNENSKGFRSTDYWGYKPYHKPDRHHSWKDDFELDKYGDPIPHTCHACDHRKTQLGVVADIAGQEVGIALHFRTVVETRDNRPTIEDKWGFTIKGNLMGQGHHLVVGLSVGRDPLGCCKKTQESHENNMFVHK